MKTRKRDKKGISLIVLVITIIVMIILAAAVIISLGQNGIIGKAQDAVDKTNLKQIQEMANVLWLDAYAGGARDVDELKEAVEQALEDEKVDLDKYEITVTTSGVTVTSKSGEELGFPIEWNTIDVMDNVSFIYSNMKFVKVSEFIPTATELAATEGAAMGATIECTQIQDMGGIVIAVYDYIYTISVITAGEYADLGITIPETGFYAVDMGSMGTDADATIRETTDTRTPYVVATVTESTINEITVGVVAKDHGATSGIKEYRYYIKESDSANYELKSTSNETTYTYTSLNADKNYNIMVEVEDNLGYIGRGSTTKGSWVTATVNEVPIPKGFVASPYDGETTKKGGLVIYELNANETAIPDTETQPTSMTTRNQYVWVPVEDFSDFVRQNFGLSYTISNTIGTSDNYWEIILGTTNMPDIQSSIEQYKYMTSATLQEIQNMYDSIKEYKGFYIARYEAGTSNIRTSENYLDESGNIVLENAVYSMMNKKPYNYIPWTKNCEMNEDTNGVVEVARSMYPETNANYGVVSTLTYGVQWDRTLDWWIEEQAKNGTEDVTITSQTNLNDSTNYGNYNNNEIAKENFNEGAQYSTDNGTNYSDITTGKTSSEGWLLTTGATEEAKVNNIYDMAGNIWEWTMEGSSADYRIHRGGFFGNDGGDNPVSDRYGNLPLLFGHSIGFRPSLYIKK